MVEEGMQGYCSGEDVELMGINDYEAINEYPPQVVGFLEGIPDDEFIDDLIQYPEVMGDYLPLLGRSKRRRRRLQRRMARMSTGRRKRFIKRLARRRKGRSRRLKMLSFLVPGGKIGKRLKMLRRGRSAMGPGGRLLKKIRARRKKRKQLRRAKVQPQRIVMDEQRETPTREARVLKKAALRDQMSYATVGPGEEEYPGDDQGGIQKAGMMLPVLAGSGLLAVYMMTQAKKKK